MRASTLGELFLSLTTSLPLRFQRLAAEDVYVGRNPKTAVFLARFAAGFAAPLELTWGCPAVYVKASVWRYQVLGLPVRTSRADAKGASLALMPRRVEGLAQALEALAVQPGRREESRSRGWARRSS